MQVSSNMLILVLLCFVFISTCLLFCFVLLFLLVCWSVGFLGPHYVLLVEETRLSQGVWGAMRI